MKLAIRTMVALALCVSLAACHRAAPTRPAAPASVTPSGNIGTALSITAAAQPPLLAAASSTPICSSWVWWVQQDGEQIWVYDTSIRAPYALGATITTKAGAALYGATSASAGRGASIVFTGVTGAQIASVVLVGAEPQPCAVQWQHVNIVDAHP